MHSSKTCGNICPCSGFQNPTQNPTRTPHRQQNPTHKRRQKVPTGYNRQNAKRPVNTRRLTIGYEKLHEQKTARKHFVIMRSRVRISHPAPEKARAEVKISALFLYFCHFSRSKSSVFPFCNIFSFRRDFLNFSRTPHRTPHGHIKIDGHEMISRVRFLIPGRLPEGRFQRRGACFVRPRACTSEALSPCPHGRVLR